MVPPPLPATAAGLLLAVGCAVAVAMAVYRALSRRAAAHRTMQAIAAGGLAFQVIHFLEHALQLGFLVLKTRESAWLSSWASGTADGLQYFCTLIPLSETPASLGVEMLHLTGNMIFLGALTAWQVAMRGEQRNIRNLNIAEKVQLFHVAEHVLLVGSLIGFGNALGISTLFGTASGTTLVTLRVGFHFGINLIATSFAVRAAFDTWRKPVKHDITVIELPHSGNTLSLPERSFDRS